MESEIENESKVGENEQNPLSLKDEKHLERLVLLSLAPKLRPIGYMIRTHINVESGIENKGKREQTWNKVKKIPKPTKKTNV